MSTPNAAVELMKGNLERHPDKVAYICEDCTLTYRELDLAGRRFASLLRSRGIEPGERVVIALPDCFAFAAALIGCLFTGAIAVAAGATQEDWVFAHIVNDSGAVLLISHLEHAPRQAAIGRGIRQIVCDNLGPIDTTGFSSPFSAPYQPSADDFAYMLYTSGSTGRPKGIPHRHASLILPCDLVGRGILGITGDDVIFSTSKLSFCYGLINSFSFALHFGATAILHPGKADYRSILEIIDKHRPSVFFSVPTVFRILVLSCAAPELKFPMRLCCSAGETLPASLFREWQHLTGLEIIDGIGASELSHHFICNIPGHAVAGSTGRVVPGYRIRLVDEAGKDVPSGCEGVMLVNGATSAPRYWNLPERSRSTMLPDGFTRLGDIFLEKDGEYYYRGRIDDMFKVDAQWVSPLVVEEALRGHPAVADCAVTAVTVCGFPRTGAFVVLSPGIEKNPDLVDELAEYLKSRLPEHMRPARFHFPDALPRTATGKINRSLLRGHSNR